MKKVFSLWIFAPLKALPVILFYITAWILPISVSSFVFGKLSRMLGPLLKVHALGLKNLALAFPEKSPEDHEKILQGVWENLGRIAGEFPHIPKITKNATYVTVKNKHILDAVMKIGKPVVFMAGHLGNWEIPHYTLINNQYRIALISRPPNNFLIRKLFDWVRSHPFTTVFFKGPEGSRHIMQHLKMGGALGVLFDQRLSDGDPLPLFNHPALTATGPAKLAKKYGALMIPVQIERLGNKVQFQVTFHEPVETDGSPATIMTTFNQLLEGWIRQRPEQWLWLHKRWKI